MEKQIDLAPIPKSNWLRSKGTIICVQFFRRCPNGSSPAFTCGRKAFATVKSPMFWVCRLARYPFR